MVCCQEVRLGLGVTIAMAGLARNDRIHCTIDRRCAARKRRHRNVRGLQPGSRRSVVCDLLLEGRSSEMAVGKRQMTIEPSKALVLRVPDRAVYP